MGTTDNKTTFETLESAKVRATNAPDTTRSYRISASVEITGGAVTGFKGGEMKPLDTEATLLTFETGWGQEPLNVSYVAASSDSEKKTQLSAALDFMTDIRGKVEQGQTFTL